MGRKIKQGNYQWDTFLSFKLSVQFRHWKEAEVINNDYLINKRIYTFFTIKKHMPHYKMKAIEENRKKVKTG